jgi:hypothetical protein
MVTSQTPEPWQWSYKTTVYVGGKNKREERLLPFSLKKAYHFFLRKKNVSDMKTCQVKISAAITFSGWVFKLFGILKKLIQDCITVRHPYI